MLLQLMWKEELWGRYVCVLILSCVDRCKDDRRSQGSLWISACDKRGEVHSLIESSWKWWLHFPPWILLHTLFPGRPWFVFPTCGCYFAVNTKFYWESNEDRMLCVRKMENCLMQVGHCKMLLSNSTYLGILLMCSAVRFPALHGPWCVTVGNDQPRDGNGRYLVCLLRFSKCQGFLLFCCLVKSFSPVRETS